jgi:hypothetical protein
MSANVYKHRCVQNPDVLIFSWCVFAAGFNAQGMIDALLANWTSSQKMSEVENRSKLGISQSGGEKCQKYQHHQNLDGV